MKAMALYDILCQNVEIVNGNNVCEKVEQAEPEAKIPLEFKWHLETEETEREECGPTVPDSIVGKLPFAFGHHVVDSTSSSSVGRLLHPLADAYVQATLVEDSLGINPLFECLDDRNHAVKVLAEFHRRTPLDSLDHSETLDWLQWSSKHHEGLILPLMALGFATSTIAGLIMLPGSLEH
ncbi:uncharacterized protein BT62DRAFT_1002440 [Guyanagaster necrorhizus]|uniref:Uncharacterized protein n=1 Tax=Guyanagaster necrorhizus TaxID=856835 RepID=A0A9P8AWE2_9AGAR|nr:uncharacterized protein BT62DRAFT_1002440 [Guyanagaster necrorhizus MCA 3950]KAG7450096.1 hypothetical protein BT62DRAFT_1002440 [Guyanagaster necrorhizus MCA 3950]